MLGGIQIEGIGSQEHPPVLRIGGDHSVAQNGFVVQFIGHAANRVRGTVFGRGIALNDFNLGRAISLFRNHFRHQTNMIRHRLRVFLKLRFPVKENQVSGPGIGLRRGNEQVVFLIGKRLYPGSAVRFQGKLFIHPRIVQAEGDEHGIPVAVGITVPRAVTGIAPEPLPIVFHNIIRGAFRVPKLGSRNG